MSAAEKWLSRVQGLLNKAEATNHPEEADAFLAKAQELMARHAIDDAMLQATGRTDRENVTTEEVEIPAPYQIPKSLLFASIAKVNNCRIVQKGKGARKVYIIAGFPSDIEGAKLLFASILTQATREMGRAKPPMGEHAKSFRHSFLVSYASRIGTRLEEARKAAEVQREQETGESSALVMVDRGDAVSALLRQEFGRLASRTVSGGRSRSGYDAGTTAANRADIGNRAVAGGSRSLPA